METRRVNKWTHEEDAILLREYEGQQKRNPSRSKSGPDLYTTSDHLPTTLLSKDKGVSYDVDKTAIQNAVGTTKTRWDWLEEKVPMDELRGKNGGYPGAPELVPLLEKAHENVNSSLTVGGSINGNVSNDAVQADSLQPDLHSRPEHAIFGIAMIGGGEITGAACSCRRLSCQA
ncbi:hypothetical protein McanMca71_000648 [Microsporum canis]